MANYFSLTLDTLGPAGVTLKINSGDTYTTDQLVTLTIGTSDGDTTGYQMLIWGAVDAAYDGDIQASEGSSAWITFAASKGIKLSSTDGSKTIYIKLRDDVHNVSSQQSASITLDTSAPTVSITGPDVSKISKISGKDKASVSFSADDPFVEYKVKVVPSSGSIHTAGAQIPTTAGSTNMSGSGSYAKDTPISCEIKGTDLETAAGSDGQHIVKVFVKDAAGNWSV